MSTTQAPITEDTVFLPTPEGLEALLHAPVVPDAPEDAEGETDLSPIESALRWTIDSEQKANWYLKQRRQAEDEIATIKAQAAAMVSALEADLNRLNARHEADFQAWAKEELARRNNGRKTLPLFQGSVAFRSVPASMRVTGTALAIEEARARGWDLVKTVESLDGEAYRKEAAALLRETGEVLPGIEIVPDRESVSIKFAKNVDAADDAE